MSSSPIPVHFSCLLTFCLPRAAHPCGRSQPCICTVNMQWFPSHNPAFFGVLLYSEASGTNVLIHINTQSKAVKASVCLRVRVACQQQWRGIRRRLTASPRWNVSKREMASIRDIQKMCVDCGVRGLGGLNYTNNCLSLGEPSVFVCGWLSKFTSTVGWGVPSRPKARKTLGWIN